MTKQLLLLIAFLSPCIDKPKPAKSDFKQIQGTWEVVSRRFKGEDEESKYRIIVTEEFLKEQPEAPGAIYVYELDPSTKPKQITMWVVLENGAPGTAIHGIYKIEGDTLTICCYLYEDGRMPTRFSAEKGEGTDLNVYHRVKPK